MRVVNSGAEQGGSGPGLALEFRDLRQPTAADYRVKLAASMNYASITESILTIELLLFTAQ